MRWCGEGGRGERGEGLMAAWAALRDTPSTQAAAANTPDSWSFSVKEIMHNTALISIPPHYWISVFLQPEKIPLWILLLYFSHWWGRIFSIKQHLSVLVVTALLPHPDLSTAGNKTVWHHIKDKLPQSSAENKKFYILDLMKQPITENHPAQLYFFNHFYFLMAVLKEADGVLHGT